MEFNTGLLNINLTDDELDQLLCLNDNNKFVTSTPKQQDSTENCDEILSSVFSKSSQFKITINSPKFDIGNGSPRPSITNKMFMDIDSSECDSNKNMNHIQTENTNNQATHLSLVKIKPSNHSEMLNENFLLPSLKSNFHFSNPTIPEALDSTMFTIFTDQDHPSMNERVQFFNSIPKFNLTTNVSSQKNFNHMPISIMELYQTVRSLYSDFAFVYAISAQMCQEFIPMDCYLTLKMTLLLSITSISSNNKPIPIVAIGPDSTLINRIMLHFGQNIPQRFLAAINDLESIGGSLTHENMIEAGPAILAKGGICYLGDWFYIKSNHADKILKEIECGTLRIGKSNLNYPLQCSIWCYWTGSFKNNTKDQKVLTAFMEIFGIPAIIGGKADSDVLVDFMFEQAVTASINIPKDELSISLNDMKEFLKIVGNRKVNFNSEALDIMQKYFVASRIERPDCLTHQSFITLKMYSESFAKLSLRYEVITADVIAAIYLTEYSIYNIFGPGIYPSPQFILVNNYIGEVDIFMKKFENWLKDYINKFN